MAFGGEFVAQFAVVVDAPVEHAGDAGHRIDDRLPAGGRQVDDFQPPVGQRNTSGCSMFPESSDRGRPSCRHPFNGGHIRPPAVQPNLSCETAHGSSVPG